MAGGENPNKRYFTLHLLHVQLTSASAGGKRERGVEGGKYAGPSLYYYDDVLGEGVYRG